MAKNEQFDETVSRWLEETAPARLPERVLSATFERTRRSKQHVGWRAILGRFRMHRSIPALGSTALVVAVVLALNFVVDQQGRTGAEDRSPEPMISNDMWPQSSLEEVREAQELADAGDPGYTWQVDPGLRDWYVAPSLEETLGDAEIVARFLREELGWEEFRYSAIPEDGFGDGIHTNAAYIRCAPGRTNALYPDDARGSGCAPTIDEVRYERVSLDLGQLVRQDPSGIWVVTRWGALPPLELAVPPSGTEATELLEAFLQARIDGDGAEEYLDVPDEGSPTVEVPLLYATTTGAPYERSEFEVIDGPRWPDGSMQFKVRLFTDDETAVEQIFFMIRAAGRLRLEYRSGGLDVAPTTENGQAVPAEYSFLDGQVTFRATWPWERLPDPSATTLGLDTNGQGIQVTLALVADPRPVETGCQEGPAPADAAALARSIRSDPDLEATAPVAVSVGGTPALRMDIVTAAGASACDRAGVPRVVSRHIGLLGSERMRLYLLDLPGGSAQILAIAFVTEQREFDRGWETAAPIVDSFEFHAP